MKEKFQKQRSTNDKKEKNSIFHSYKNSALILLYLKTSKTEYTRNVLDFTANTQDIYIYIYRFMHDYDPVRRREASWKWDTRKRKISERLFYDKENKEIVRDTDGFMVRVGERVLETNRLREKHFNLTALHLPTNLLDR